MLKTNEAYSVKEIAEVIKKSENYVSRKLKSAGIVPEGYRVTAMGPNSKVWKGATVSSLIKNNLFSNINVGDVVWYENDLPTHLKLHLGKDKDSSGLPNYYPDEVADKPTQVYLIKAYLIDDNQRKPIYKIGITNKKDVVKGRFKEEVTTGLLEDVNVLASCWCKTRLEAEQLEEHLFKLVIDQFGGYKMTDGSGEERFHNFWTKDQPKGITEMRKLNVKETKFLIEYFENVQIKTV